MAFTFHQPLTILVILLALGSTSQALRGRLLDKVAGSLEDEKHDAWASTHGKVYKDEEEKEERKKVFEKNLEYIEKFNSQPNKSFKLKPNAFADLTNQEFHESRTGGYQMLNLTRSLTSATMSFPSNYRTQGVDDYGADYSTSSASSIPSSVDWTGHVNPIRDQTDKCGSCWAFAVVAAIESKIHIKTGKLPNLSEQQLVDCVRGPNTFKCKGGNPDEAFTYIKQNGGITSEASYPYKAKNGTCTGTQHAFAAKIAGYVDVPNSDEEALRFAVSQQPVVAFIDSRGPQFQFYAGGVYDASCGTQLDHLVTLVGYGTTQEGVPYWLVRNSWSTNWGEAGYMRLLRNNGFAEGQCGIAMFTSYPVL